jgi:hypothetical protein
MGPAIARPETAAHGLRRRGRAGGRLQRPAGRRAIHGRDHARYHHGPRRAARPGVLLDRDRCRLAVPARPGDVRRTAQLPVHCAPADLGAGGRAADRRHRKRLHPPHRLGIASPGERQGRPDGAAARVRGARPHCVRLPTVARQRPGHGPRRLHRLRKPAAPASALHAQAARHGNVPGQRRVRRPLHAHTQYRRRAWRCHGDRVEPRVAWVTGGRLRPRGRGGHARRRHAGVARGAGPDAGTDLRPVPAHDPHDRRDGRGDHDRPPDRWLFHLHGTPAGISGNICAPARRCLRH